MIADIHPHVISTDPGRHPLAPLGGVQSAWSRERPVSFEKLISEMDRAGIDKAAIVQASTAYGHDNSYVAEAIAAHPRRFTGVFSVDVLAADAVDKMRHWLSRGFGGMRLFTTGSTMPGQATWFDDPHTFPAWRFAGEAGIPVCMQMTSDGFAALRALMDRFPDVRIILDHCARPHLIDGPPFAADAGLFGFADNSNIFLKVTPLNFAPANWGKATPQIFLGKLLAAFGAARLAFGSNFPATEGTLKEILGKARDAFSFASAEDQGWIFGGTAQRLYPMLAAAGRDAGDRAPRRHA
jgi:predicted TIM-barrel fold metal-dependent hydrolase